MNDKQKMAVVVVLVVLVLGIGAFQFVNMSNPEPPKAAAEDKKDDNVAEAENTPASDPMLELYALNAKPRDPFQEESLPLIEGAEPAPPNPPPTTSAPTVRPPRPMSGGFTPPFKVNGLPGVGNPSLNPDRPLVNPDEPDFRVNGVILGARPAAVFVDGNGNQRLVTVGSSLDGDSQLVSVEKGKVTVRRKGKTLTYNVGGTPDAK